jgi:general stress protein 26
MKKYRSFNFILLFLGSLALLPSFAQQVNKRDSAELKLRRAAFDIIKSTPYCALITLDKDGHPIARKMDPFFPDSNFVVWFGTNPKSRKVAEIKNDSSVCLYYGNSEVGYVIIQGIAQLVNDENEKNKHWKSGWSVFYKNKSTDYLLIKVIPVRLEVVNYKLGVVNDPVTWDVPFIKF